MSAITSAPRRLTLWPSILIIPLFSFVVPAKAGTHTPQRLSSAAAYGSRASLCSPGTTVMVRRRSLLRLELHRHAVDAVAQPRRRRTVREDVAEMTAAAAA